MITHSVLVFCASLFVCALVTPALSVIARRVGLVDRPGGRKRHQGAVPLTGGIAIFLSISCAAAFGVQVDIPLLLSLGGLLLVGIYDDLFDMAWMKKLLAQIGICIFLMTATGVHIRSLGTLPGDVELLLGDVGYALTILAMVGLINAINMIDGLDGLAGGVSILALFHLVLAMHLIDRPMSAADLTLIIALCGALTAFLVFNLTQGHGKIFLGDAGAMMLGLFLAYFLIKASQTQPLTSTLPTSLVAWIVALPVFETLTLMVRRILAGRSPFAPDRNHLHHLLLDCGCSKYVSLVIAIVLSLALTWTGYALSSLGGTIAGAAFLGSIAIYYLAISAFQRISQLG